MMPVFGYTAVPLQVKAALGFVLALALAPTASLGLQGATLGPLPLVGAAIAEAAVGLVIGAATILILAGAEFAGTLVGLQMGFSIVNVMDPQQEQEVSLIGRLEYLLALMIFIALDGHHMLLGALAESFRVVPLGGGTIGAEPSLLFARMSAELLVVAVKLAAPVLAILLLTEIALGFVARAMPQMNVFIISFPLKIGVGMLAMAVTWPLFAYVLAKSIDKFGGDIVQLMRIMGR